MLDTETQLTSTPPYHLNQFIYHITTSSSITVHSSQVKTPSGNHRVQFAALLLAAALALLLLRADTDFPLVSHPDSVEESLKEDKGLAYLLYKPNKCKEVTIVPLTKKNELTGFRSC